MTEFTYDELMSYLIKRNTPITNIEGSSSDYSIHAMVNDKDYHRIIVRPEKKKIEMATSAYSVGRDVYFSVSQDASLPHEKVHVIQQICDRVPASIDFATPVSVDYPLEEEDNSYFIRSFEPRG